MAASNRKVDLVLVRGEGQYLSNVPANVNLAVLNKRRVSDAIAALASHIRATRPDAVLSALTHMNIAAIMAARVSGAAPRIVVSERNQISEKSRGTMNWRQRTTYGAVRWLYPAADAVVAVSRGVARDLETFGKLSAAKLHVIHNPVFDSEIDALAKEEPAHPWLRDRYPPVVLAVGRLHRQKGFDVLLRAFALARAQVNCRLVIAGEGAEREKLFALARELGVADNFSLPGFCANPFALMARASVFVLSSRWEGFPNALVEAMACGARVVATDCPSGPREILDGGRYGRLVPVDDAQGLAAALIEGLAARRGTAVARAHAQGFSVDAATARYLDVLEARP